MEKQAQQRIQENFNRQGFMQTLGAKIRLIENGQVIIQCTFNDGLSQQNNFFHAGVLTSIADSACGYAAYTLMPGTSDVLTVEFKINFLKPANVQSVLAIGKVIQSGKTLTVCEGFVTDERQQQLFAKMTATLIVISDKR